jgi:hypothetical protein
VTNLGSKVEEANTSISIPLDARGRSQKTACQLERVPAMSRRGMGAQILRVGRGRLGPHGGSGALKSHLSLGGLQMPEISLLYACLET